MRIRELLLLGLCACLDGVGDPGDTPQHHDVTITDPSPPMQLRIESCRADISACMALCNAVATANQYIGAVVGCKVSFDGNTTYVGIDISTFINGGGIP